MINNITAVILTKNEEKDIADCLETLGWCDEVIVLDDNSSDKTVEIARGMKARVISNSLDGNFSSQRNYGLEKAKGEWALFVDADERVSKKLSDEILSAIKKNHFNGFFIQRADYLWGRKLLHGETGNIQLLRLGRKGSGEWIGKVHEVWEIEGQVGTLKNEMSHYPHQTVEKFLKELNSYTDIRARELFEKGEKTNIFFIIFYTKGKFFLNYIIKLGFLDGVPGLLHAMLMSFHSFLVRSKLWLLYEKKKKKS